MTIVLNNGEVIKDVEELSFSLATVDYYHDDGYKSLNIEDIRYISD